LLSKEIYLLEPDARIASTNKTNETDKTPPPRPRRRSQPVDISQSGRGVPKVNGPASVHVTPNNEHHVRMAWQNRTGAALPHVDESGRCFRALARSHPPQPRGAFRTRRESLADRPAQGDERPPA
jgi:hypothetical protein